MHLKFFLSVDADRFSFLFSGTTCKTHRKASLQGMLVLFLGCALVYSSILGPNKHVMWSAVLRAHAAASQGWLIMTISDIYSVLNHTWPSVTEIALSFCFFLHGRMSRMTKTSKTLGLFQRQRLQLHFVYSVNPTWFLLTYHLLQSFPFKRKTTGLVAIDLGFWFWLCHISKLDILFYCLNQLK